jgi:putative flippase GtrA
MKIVILDRATSIKEIANYLRLKMRQLDINNFKTLFVCKSDNFYIQAFRYVFVGGIAFVADASLLYLSSLLGIHYLICTAMAFVVGLIVNYLLSKIFVFTEKAKTGAIIEFVIYAVIGVIGLVITELLMWLFTDIVGIYFMLSKIITAIIVLVWNFLTRKFTLYHT